MRTAHRILTAATDIDRLRGLIEHLGEGHAVAVRLDDGSEVRGIVSERPTLQQFFDAAGNEGTNAWLRLDEPAMDQPEAAGWCDIWLDRVNTVRDLDPVEHVRLRNASHVPSPRLDLGRTTGSPGRAAKLAVPGQALPTATAPDPANPVPTGWHGDCEAE